MSRKFLLIIAAGLLAIAAVVPVAQAINRGQPPAAQRQVQALAALGNGFTYQGRLTEGGAPANGVYDLRFILYDADAGGAQVGSTVDKQDVSVTNGLFTTQLDFGASAFDGNARWLEIAVRPGASSGTYTVLSPRQEITAVPYALYAKSAGLALPFSATATTNGLNTAFKLTQAGTAIGLQVDRTSTGAETNPAILGTNAGSGAGVIGKTSYDGGGAYGVIGDASDAAQGSGGLFTGPSSVTLDGPVRVTGSNPTAFVHVASGGSYISVIDNPITNGDPDAILIVTHHFDPPGAGTGIYHQVPFGVWYNGSKWTIYNEDQTTAIAAGDSFNVLVIKR